MKENKIPKAKSDKTGMHFGHWIVKCQNLEKSQETGRVCWLCECDCGCGTTKTIRTDALVQVKVGGCDNMASSVAKKCDKCKKIFYPKKQAKTRRYCYDCQPENCNVDRKLIKNWALEYKGHECVCCGYSACVEALEFHHLDENEKDFCISDKETNSKSWTMIKKELDKCILVCANCHREIHAGVRKID